MCEDGAGQFHHDKATNRIYGCFFISYFFSWPCWLSCEWCTWMSGTIYNIFLCRGGKDCVRKKPSYMSYFAAFLQTPYCYYSKAHVMGFLQHFELEGPWNCEIIHWVSRWSFFVRRCSIRRSQSSSPWNGLFVWVTTEVKFSWRHLCATLL